MSSSPQGLSSSQQKIVSDILHAHLLAKDSFSVSFFGSRSKKTFRKYSDLDLWIETSPSLTRAEIADIYEAMEESDLPIKIDIVTPETCLKEFLPHILSEKVLWYSKTTIK